MNSVSHQSNDLFAGARQWGDAPRFFLPAGEGYTAVSWQQYADDVRALGGFLTRRIALDDKVAILGQTSYAWIVAYSAVQSVRGVVVPIYPASKGDLIAYFLEHSDAKVLCCDQAFLGELAGIDLAGIEEIILLDADAGVAGFKVPVYGQAEALSLGLEHRAAFESALAGVSEADLATIIYTSGTTGLPKGVMLTHANLAASAADWISLNGPMIPDEAVDLHWLPLAHAFGIGAIMLGNRLGWQSYFATPKNVLEKFKDVRPHTFLSVPAFWEKLYLAIQTAGGNVPAFDKVTGGRLVFGLSGGAGLKKEIKQGFHEMGLLVIEGYGLTECSPTLTMNRRERFNFDSVGVPYPSVLIKLAEDGEILAQGPNIFKGYFKNPEATAEAFDTAGWFKTGDVGMWTPDGFLRIIDRKKEILVTSGGKNVPPANIEHKFQDNPLIQHLIVYGDGKKYLTALVTLNEEAVRDALGDQGTPWDALARSQKVLELVERQVADVNESLASYETIKKVWISPAPLTVEDNLLTSSFKPRRKAIYEHYGAELEALYG
ncbi:MAG: long-chain fatty acid--CoA ligase [Candidatus Sericytochromatia bacterium]